jgi:putative autotransporter adhesin-like protein
MKLFSFLMIALMAAAFGCSRINNATGVRGSGNLKTENRTLSGFTKIKAAGAVQLDITPKGDFSVSVETDDNLLEHLTTEVSGDTLVISTKGDVSSSTAVKIRISMPELKDVDLSGASTATIAGIKTDKLDLTASGASKIKIDGEVRSLEAEASGASGIDAENLRVENADADSSGASTITVNAANDAKLTASGASTVVYVGDPKNLTQNSSGVSSIKKK